MEYVGRNITRVVVEKYDEHILSSSLNKGV
jgi:hypothetical protein